MSTIVCRGLSFGYDGSEKNVFTNLDLLVDTARRSALVGRNGRGKTTLLRLLHGELTPDRGTIERAVATRRFPCTPSGPAISAFEAAKDAAGPFRRWEAEMDRLLDVGDEPLNFIDVVARELIEEAVSRDTPTLVFVEHDAAFIDRVSTSRVELVPRTGRS